MLNHLIFFLIVSLYLFDFLNFAASLPLTADEDDSSGLPFNVDMFTPILEESSMFDNLLKAPVIDSDVKVIDSNKKDDRGPPSIGEDIFDPKFVEENVKNKESEPEESVSSKMETENENSNKNTTVPYDYNTSDTAVHSENVLSSKTKKVVESGSEVDPVIPEQVETREEQFVISSFTNCPPPKICGKNCFVSLNKNGCQDCQCLWISDKCTVDSDCKNENQYCDLGRCNCGPGYQQNMKRSGLCELEKEKQLVPIVSSRREINLKDLSKQVEMRAKRESKPRSAERLEWPGICDRSEQCPDNLVCINGDCWILPNKTNRDESLIKKVSGKTTSSVAFSPKLNVENVPKLFQNSEKGKKKKKKSVKKHTYSTTESPKKLRGEKRFVSEGFLNSIQRTTTKQTRRWFPPTTTTDKPSYEKTSKYDIPPLNVDKFVMIETTSTTVTPSSSASKVIDDHKLEFLKEKKENIFGNIDDLHIFDSVFQISTTIPPSHIKEIHIENETRREDKQKKRKLRTTTIAPDSSENIEDDDTAIDEIEFPISSKIGKTANRPRALSAIPTPEELKDHKTLLEIFNDYEKKHIKKVASVIPKADSSDAFPNDYDFTETRSTPENKSPIFSPAPVFPYEEIKKPYIINPSIKFTKIDPIEHLSEDMASENPPEVIPEPAPFNKHLMGVWYPMRKGDIPHLGIFGGELRRSPSFLSNRVPIEHRLYHEYTQEKRKNQPVRIEMDNAIEHVKNECSTNEHCGNMTKCCTKKWCDRTNNCGTGKFCLPTCNSTKLTFLPSSDHAESIIDIIYD